MCIVCREVRLLKLAAHFSPQSSPFSRGEQFTTARAHELIFAASPNLDLHDAIVLALYGGLRPHEMERLLWKNVVPVFGRLTVSGKHGSRTIPMNHVLRSALSERFERQLTDEFVFGPEPQNRIAQFEKWLPVIAGRCGLSVTFHTLRQHYIQLRGSHAE